MKLATKQARAQARAGKAEGGGADITTLSLEVHLGISFRLTDADSTVLLTYNPRTKVLSGVD